MYFTTAGGVSYVKTLSNASFMKFAIPFTFSPV
jgi:hypothetical protein